MDLSNIENGEIPRFEVIPLKDGRTLVPISTEELNQRLHSSFAEIENAPGSHAVIDTPWQKFAGEMNVTPLLERLYQRDGNIDVLDVGCGSSLTLFQAVEDIEQHKPGGKVNGFGVTASPDYLNRGVEPAFREHILGSTTVTGEELKRQKLLLAGVQHDEQKGDYRETPIGNTIQIKKADAHFLQKAFPGQKFDLIYSSAAYAHFAAPWVAFEQSCNALNEGGVLMIDAIPTTDVFNHEGEVVSPEEYAEILQRNNPGYKVHFKSSPSNPFYSPIIVEKLTNDDIKTGSMEAQVKNRDGLSNQRIVQIITP
jgi:SAM-dependent methyltransferase